MTSNLEIIGFFIYFFQSSFLLVIQIVIAIQMYGCEIMFITRLLKCPTARSLLLVTISSCAVSRSRRGHDSFIIIIIYYCCVWPNEILSCTTRIVLSSYIIQNTKQYPPTIQLYTPQAPGPGVCPQDI